VRAYAPEKKTKSEPARKRRVVARGISHALKMPVGQIIPPVLTAGLASIPIATSNL